MNTRQKSSNMNISEYVIIYGAFLKTCKNIKH